MRLTDIMNQNLDVITTVGELTVFNSGVIVTNDTRISFSIQDLRFIFEFEDNGDKPQYRIDAVEGNTAIIRLFNFTNVLGTGRYEPVEIASLDDGRSIWISWTVYKVGDESTNRSLHYTFYIGGSCGK